MFSPFLGFEKGIQKQGPGLPGLCGVWLAAREVFEFKLQRDLPFDDWDFSHLGAAFFLALLVSMAKIWIQWIPSFLAIFFFLGKQVVFQN